jgi:hypothetical protein
VTARGDAIHDLIAAVHAVRAAAAEVSYPLPLPSADPARAEAAALLAQVDDYALPRLTRLDAPLLVVVGGSTGAGRSTLVNSLVRAPVSPAGVLRPTTRTPVLVCNPVDTAWFRSGGLLTSGVVTQLIAAPALAAGLALLDVPDFGQVLDPRSGPAVRAGLGQGRDAVVDENRALAHQLLAAADLWLFVTTAARYADAVPWELLHLARERGTVVALVLDRVPQHGSGPVEVVGHLTELLTAHGLASVPLFVLPETRVDGQGLLPEEAVSPLRVWCDGLSGDAPAREAVARCTLDGALAALPRRIEALAAAAAEQATTAVALAEMVGMAYGGSRAGLEHDLAEDAALDRGRPVRGARRARPSRTGGAAATHASRTGIAIRDHLDPGAARLVAVVCAAAAEAAEQARLAWRSNPTGYALLTPELARSSPGLPGQVERLIRGGDGMSPEELLARVGHLLDAEAARWLDRLAGVPPDGGPVRLRAAGAALERARVAAALGTDPTLATPAPTPTPDQPGPADPAGGADLTESSGMAAR